MTPFKIKHHMLCLNLLKQEKSPHIAKTNEIQVWMWLCSSSEGDKGLQWVTWTNRAQDALLAPSKARPHAAKPPAWASCPVSAAPGISAHAFAITKQVGEWWSNWAWEKGNGMRNIQDQDIPPHPLQRREVIADTGHGYTCHTPPSSHSPGAAESHERGGNPMAPCTFQLQLKATTLWDRKSVV